MVLQAKLEQSLVMNVTALPAGGASYRVYKTTADGRIFLVTL